MTQTTAEAESIPTLSHTLSQDDVRGMWRVRWGIGRNSYTVAPGLYRLGNPDPSSPILVTANYKFTVDIVRRDTDGVDAWLLVLDTKGVNVWCAAGKRTFGTSELIGRVLRSSLPLVAESQTLVLPQLGAPGVAGHEVRRATGYRVVYGPVRAEDIPEYLKRGMKATPEMRTVTFTTRERLELAPVELVGAFAGWRWAVPVGFAVATAAAWLGIAALRGTFAAGAGASAAAAAMLGLIGAFAYVEGVLLGGFGVPVLLPWIPGRMFATKGTLLGILAAALLLVSLAASGLGLSASGMVGVFALAGGWGLLVTAVSSYVAMNFTGSSPFTSPSGVERELRRWIPVQAVIAALGLIGWFGGLWAVSSLR